MTQSSSDRAGHTPGLCPFRDRAPEGVPQGLGCQGDAQWSSSDPCFMMQVPTHYVRLIEVFDSMSEEDQRASAKAAGKLRLMVRQLALPTSGPRQDSSGEAAGC